MAYGPKQIAKELTDTALGNSYHGNALYVAQDIPSLTHDERLCVLRWLNGNQHSCDHIELHDIANKIALFD